MHGHKRADYKARLQDPKTAAGLAQKAEKWHALMGGLAERRRQEKENEGDSPIDDTLPLLAKALLVNPDPTHLWNHRRELLLLLQTAETPLQERMLMLSAELELTQASLQRNPKAYGAWFHRKWALQHYQPSAAILQQELSLTAKLLSLDERNFHCWNYRRLVVACLATASASDHSNSDPSTSSSAYSWNGEWKEPRMGKQIQIQIQIPTTGSTVDMVPASPPDIPHKLLLAEWQFTETKIQDNFSNFSAFHYRSQLLPHMLLSSRSNGDVSNNPSELLEAELQLIENAICTEPDDQTAWWYHAMLLDAPHADTINQERWLEHLDLLRELLQDAPTGTGKWILLGLHKVLTIKKINPEEQRSVLEQLSAIDPDRAQRYQELLSRVTTPT